MNEKLNLDELEQATGGTFIGYGYWNPSAIQGQGVQGPINMYRSPVIDPAGIVLQLQDGDPVMVYSKAPNQGWSLVKARNIVTGYVETKYIAGVNLPV